MEDEEYRPRADDHRVEPFLAGLAGSAKPAAPEEPGRGASGARRGCAGAVLFLAALAAGLWLAG